MPAGSERLDLNLDIVGGAVRGLCLVARACQRVDHAGRIIVDLPFTRHDRANVAVDHDAGVLVIEVPTAAPLVVRRSRWAELEPDAGWVDEGAYLVAPALRPGDQVRIPFRAMGREVVLHHRTRSIEATLEGSTVATMRSFGAPLTFFEERA
jgi:hypothetical protein